MKKVLLVIILATALISCSSDCAESSTDYVSVTRGDVVVTKITYEQHEYLVFRGGDYFSAVVHSASCPCQRGR